MTKRVVENIQDRKIHLAALFMTIGSHLLVRRFPERRRLITEREKAAMRTNSGATSAYDMMP